MKIPYILAMPILLCGGCVSSSSPVQLPQTVDHTSVSQAVDIVGGAGLGAAGGYALTHNALGAAAGGAVGAIGGAVVANVESDAKARRVAELVEAARRAERVKILNEYWESERYQKQGGPNTTETRFTNEVNYPGGLVDNVNVAPRRSDDEEAPLDEPKR